VTARRGDPIRYRWTTTERVLLAVIVGLALVLVILVVVEATR
jgi:hypothetical protein